MADDTVTVWDGFMYNGETEAFRTRMRQLNEIGLQQGFSVTHVLVESKMTHTGIMKEKLFCSRDKLPNSVRIVEFDISTVSGAYPKEKAQRDAIAGGMRDAKPTDVVMISDVDEIPSQQAVCHAIDQIRL